MNPKAHRGQPSDIHVVANFVSAIILDFKYSLRRCNLIPRFPRNKVSILN